MFANLSGDYRSQMVFTSHCVRKQHERYTMCILYEVHMLKKHTKNIQAMKPNSSSSHSDAKRFHKQAINLMDCLWNRLAKLLM